MATQNGACGHGEVGFLRAEKHEYHVLLIDLIDERFSLSVFENSIHTISTEYKKALYRPNRYGFVKAGSEKKLRLWKEGLKKLSDYLIINGLDRKIVVNRVYWSLLCDNPEKLFDRYTEEFVRVANEQLEWMYGEIEKCFPNAKFIKYTDDELELDEQHKWGLEPFHFTEKAFIKQLSALYAISTSDITDRNLHNFQTKSSGVPAKMNINFIEFYSSPVNTLGDFLCIERGVHHDDDLLFLEDVITENKREVVAVTRNSNKMLRISDEGTCEEFEISNYCKRKIKNCHTLKNGNRILQETAEPCEVFLVDEAFRLIKKVQAGQRLWHGTNSVNSTASACHVLGVHCYKREKCSIALRLVF